jgi:hypothetical protein
MVSLSSLLPPFPGRNVPPRFLPAFDKNQSHITIAKKRMDFKSLAVAMLFRTLQDGTGNSSAVYVE